MSSRYEDLLQLTNYTKEVDKEITNILQILQWDRKLLLQHKPKSTCKYDSNHKIIPEKLKEHEEKCVFKSQGYVDKKFSPEAFDANSNTFIKLTSENVRSIIHHAIKTNPVYNRGNATVVSKPSTLECQQATCTMDEKHADNDAVIKTVPLCHDLPDMSKAGGAGESTQDKNKSRMEQLAEQRDLRRRRARYRVPAGSNNYSHALRALIGAQMEMLTEVQDQSKSTSCSNGSNNKTCVHKNGDSYKRSSKISRNDVTEYDRLSKDKRNIQTTTIKEEPCSDNETECDYDEDRRPPKIEKIYLDRDSNAERGKRDVYKHRSQERERRTYKDKTADRRYDKYNVESKHWEKNCKKYPNREERVRYSSKAREDHRYRNSIREDPYGKDRLRNQHRNERRRYDSSQCKKEIH